MGIIEAVDVEAVAGEIHGAGRKDLLTRTEDDRSLTFLTKGDARAWLSRTHDAIAKGTWEPPSIAGERRAAEARAAALRDVTFADYAEQWLARIESEPGKGGRMRKPGTILTYRGRVRNYLLGPLGDVPVREIDDDRVRALARSLVALPSVLRPGAATNGVAALAIDVLKMILRAAVGDGVLAAMPVVPTPAQRSVRHDQDHTQEDDVATPAQVEALYAAVPERWRIAVLLAAWCQLRRGEALGLQRRDIVWSDDGASATLFVRCQKNGSTGDLTDPKSDKGVRSMSVPPLMLDRLQEHLDAHVASGRTAPVVPQEAGSAAHVRDAVERRLVQASGRRRRSARGLPVP